MSVMLVWDRAMNLMLLEANKGSVDILGLDSE
jgi:hypothetical protein